VAYCSTRKEERAKYKISSSIIVNQNVNISCSNKGYIDGYTVEGRGGGATPIMANLRPSPNSSGCRGQPQDARHARRREGRDETVLGDHRNLEMSDYYLSFPRRFFHDGAEGPSGELSTADPNLADQRAFRERLSGAESSSVNLVDKDGGGATSYFTWRKARTHLTLQGKVYNFLERPTGWRCFLYHFTV